MWSLFGRKNKPFYGWVVVVTFFLIGTTIWGIRYSFGVFFKSIEGDFELTRAVTSAIFSTQLVLGGSFSILSGWTLDRYGPRIVLFLMGLFTGLGLLITSQTNAAWQLFITYGLFLAMGTSPIYTAVMASVSRWFDKKRGLALGIASSGTGLGQVVVAPFATYLITGFDWRLALIVIGLLTWVIVMPLSRLLKKDPQEVGALPDGTKTPPLGGEGEEKHLSPDYFSLSQSFRTTSFWLILFGFLLFGADLFLVLTHLVPHITDIGFSPAQAASIFSLAGASAVIGRIFISFASDRIGRKAASVICILLHAVAMVWLIWAEELWQLSLFAIVFGLGWGGYGPSMAALIGDTFGLGKIGAIIGVLDAGFGIGAGLGPVIGGLIFDIRQSYFLAFLLDAVAMVVVALLTVMVRRETRVLGTSEKGK